MAIISLSCEKSAYRVRFSGKVVGEEFRVRLVWVLSWTGNPVSLARSSLM